MGIVSPSVSARLTNQPAIASPSVFARARSMASIPARSIYVSLLPILTQTAAFAGTPSASDSNHAWTSLAVSSAVTGIGLLGHKIFSSNPSARNVFSKGVLPLGIGGILGGVGASMIGADPAIAQAFQTYFPAMAIGGLAIAGVGAFSLFVGLHSKMMPFAKNFLIPTSLILMAALSVAKLDLLPIDRHESGRPAAVAQQTPGTSSQHVSSQPGPGAPRTAASFLAPTDALLRIVESNDGVYGDDSERAMCIESSSNLYFIYLDKAIEEGRYREAYSNLVKLFNSSTPSGASFRDLIEAGAKKNNNMWGAANYYSYRARLAELMGVNSDNEAGKTAYFEESAENYLMAQQCVFNFLGSPVRLASIADIAARSAEIDKLIAANPGSDAKKALALASAGWAGAKANLIASSTINREASSVKELQTAVEELEALTRLKIEGQSLYDMPKTTPFLFSNIYGYTGNAMVRLVQEEMPDSSRLSGAKKSAYLERLATAESQYILPAIRHPYTFYGNIYDVQLNADQICGLDDRYTFNMTRALSTELASKSTKDFRDFITMLYWRQNGLVQSYATRAFITGESSDAVSFDDLNDLLVPGGGAETLFSGIMGSAAWKTFWE